jgi:hypothetical protein
MITYGFVPSFGDAVTIGTAFASDGISCVSLYINIGTAGDLVWINAQNQAQWSPGLQAGQEYIIGAIKIVSSATVNGVSRTTTASNIAWRGLPVYNTP